MYEHVRGILKYKISLNFIENGNILTSFRTYSTQEIVKNTLTIQTCSNQKYSIMRSQVIEIRYSTQRLDTQLQRMIFDFGYSTPDTQLNKN